MSQNGIDILIIGNAKVVVSDDTTTMPSFGPTRLLAPDAIAAKDEVTFETRIGVFAFKPYQPEKAQQQAQRLKDWWNGKWKFLMITVQMQGGVKHTQEGVPSDLPTALMDQAILRVMAKAKDEVTAMQHRIEVLLPA